MDFSDEKFNYLISLFNSDKWEVYDNKNDIVMERMFLPATSTYAYFKSSSFIHASPEELLQFVLTIYTDESTIKNYDSDITHYEMIDLDIRLCHQINKLPWPIWKREFVYVQHIKKNDNIIWLYMYSVESELVPKHDDLYVRADIDISAYIFVPENDGCQIYRLMHIDPKGSIPVSVVNNQANKTITVIEELQKIYNQ